jgi:hypothetical protein
VIRAAAAPRHLGRIKNEHGIAEGHKLADLR